MKLEFDTKNPRIIRDEEGNELFKFTGEHLEDLREIIAKVNYVHRMTEDNEYKGYYKSRVSI